MDCTVTHIHTHTPHTRHSWSAPCFFLLFRLSTESGQRQFQHQWICMHTHRQHISLLCLKMLPCWQLLEAEFYCVSYLSSQFYLPLGPHTHPTCTLPHIANLHTIKDNMNIPCWWLSCDQHVTVHCHIVMYIPGLISLAQMCSDRSVLRGGIKSNTIWRSDGGRGYQEPACIKRT